MSSERRWISIPSRPRPRALHEPELLSRVGAEVDVLIVVHGRAERWRGIVTRALGVAGLVALRPAGCGSEIEFEVGQVREVSRYEPRSRASRSIEQVQAARLGRRAR